MKKLSKKLLTVLLALAMVVSVAAVGVLAAEGTTPVTLKVDATKESAEKREDGATYKTLNEAVQAAVAGDTIQLTADVTLADQEEINKEITLDLGGFTLTKAATVAENKSILRTGTGGNLTIQNGYLSGAGTLVLAAEGKITLEKNLTVQSKHDSSQTPDDKNDTAVAATGNAELVVKCSIEESESGVGAFGSSKVVIDGAQIHSTYFGLSTHGSLTTDANIEVKGESDICGGDVACGVYLPKGTLTIEGKGHIIGGAGIVVRGGKLTVKEDYEGVITATSKTPVTVGDAKKNTEKYPVPAAAVVLDKNDSYGLASGGAPVTLENSKGNFEAQGENPAVVYSEVGEDKSKETGTAASSSITVKGGNFTSPVSEKLLDSTIKAQLKGSNNRYSYYTSEANAHAADPKGEVELTSTARTQPNPKGYTVFDTTAEITINDPSGGTEVTIKVYKGKGTTTPAGLDDIKEQLDAGDNTFTLDLSTLSGGLYTVCVGDGSTADKYGTIDLTLYKTTYEAGAGVQGATTDVFTGSEADFKELLDSDAYPNSFSLLPGMNKWTDSEHFTNDYNVTVKVGGTYVSPIDPEHKCPLTAQFKDMGACDPDELWYHTAMDYMVLNKYIQGYDDGTLQPNATATRAHTWVIVAQIKGKTETDSTLWWKPALDWAKAKNYIAGTEDPVKDTTREELVTFLWKVEGQPKADAKFLDAFPDKATVSDSAKTAMAWAVSKGILHGKDHELDGKIYLDPQSTGTRAEIAVLIYNWATLMK